MFLAAGVVRCKHPDIDAAVRMTLFPVAGDRPGYPPIRRPLAGMIRDEASQKPSVPACGARQKWRLSS
jgi:hypothetical protein